MKKTESAGGLHSKSRTHINFIRLGTRYIEMSVSTNISGYHINVRELWYSIYKRKFEPPPANTAPSKPKCAPPEPFSISKLEAPCKGHDVVRIDLTPNRLQPR
jgi:hypothetical protein